MPYRPESLKWVEYHSKDWEILVEQGWLTKSVEDFHGTRMALMSWQFQGW